MEGKKEKLACSLEDVEVALGCIIQRTHLSCIIRFWWWQFGAAGVTVTDRCLESGWYLGVFVYIIPSLTQELLRLGTFWGLHNRMGGLLLGLWGVCWPRCRFGIFFQPQRVMIWPQLWWQKFCMMLWRLVLRIWGLSAPQQPVVQGLILEMMQLLLVAASAVDSSTVLSSSL